MFHMRDDLLREPIAAVDWAIAQLEITKSRVEAWCKPMPYTLVTELDPKMGKKAIKYLPVDIPSVINVEAGVIINCIRSSLDILAVALAARNGFPNSKDTYFPICGSVNDFVDPLDGGLKKIKRLSDRDRTIIERLAPYQGGNDMLYALHQMDITRKHRKLLTAHCDLQFSLGGTNIAPIWSHELPIEERPEDKTILAWINPGAPDAYAGLTVEVSLARGETLAPAPVAPALREFCSLAYWIIGLF
jgi:hypothetical protein